MIYSLLGDHRKILLIVNLISTVIFKDVIKGVLRHYHLIKGYTPSENRSMVRQIISLNESSDEQSLVHVRKDCFFFSLYDHKSLPQVKKISL